MQAIEPPPTTLLDAVRGFKPEPPPELPPQKLPAVSEPSGQAPEPSEPPAPSEEEAPEIEIPPKRPEDDEDTPYIWGRKIAQAISSAMQSGNFKAAEAIATAVDAADWLSKQIPRVISSFDGPQDLSDLLDAATKHGPHPGYDDHHIVEAGPQNDDLSPSDQERIEEDDNIARIPYYAHRCITAYYQMDREDLGNITPRQFLRDQSFEQRYEFGLKVMKICGVLRP